jgi:hypothetical protein
MACLLSSRQFPDAVHLQLLAPLVAAGVLNIADVAALSLPAVGTGTVGLMIALTMASAVGAAGPGAEAVVAAARSGAVSLVALTPPNTLRIKKVREALASNGAGEALAALFPELEQLQTLAPRICGAVAEGGEAADAVVGAINGLPEAVRTCRDFARGVVTIACAAAVSDAGGAAAGIQEGIARAQLVLRAAVGHAEVADGEDADAVGAHCLSGVQTAVYADEERQDGALRAAFSALAAPAPGELPIIKPGAFRAWRDAAPFKAGAPAPRVLAEPLGREGALAEVAEVVAGLAPAASVPGVVA